MSYLGNHDTQNWLSLNRERKMISKNENIEFYP